MKVWALQKTFFLVALAIFAVLYCWPGTPAADAAGTGASPPTNPKVILNGTLLSFDVPPVIVNGRTLVPFRKILESLGAEVSWDQVSQTVTAVKDGTKIVLTIGRNTAYRNNSLFSLDVAPRIISGRTLVPLRFVSEALSARVDWNGTTRTASIYTDLNNNIELISWEDFNNTYPSGTVVTITDVEKGISYKAKRWNGYNHADSLPLTGEDRKILQTKIYNGPDWARRAVIVTVTDSQGRTRKFAAAQHGMPHLTGNSDTGSRFDLGENVPPNGFVPGTRRKPYHFCLYFWGSRGHGNTSYRLDYSLLTLKAADYPENRIDEKLAELGLHR